jgi:hypothetical protein
MQLREYQKNISDRALEILKQYNMVYLAMQTRTGKTITAMETAKKYGAKNILFVTKKKAMKSIESDYSGYRNAFCLTIINHESLHKVVGDFDLYICDEHHCIGQFPKPNNRYKILKSMVGGKPVIMLSATPSPESYSQLYHQLNISRHSPFNKYYSFYMWARVYVNVKKKYVYNREINDYSECDKKILWESIKHLFITFTQAEAGFEVEVDERIISCEMPFEIERMIGLIKRDKFYEDDELIIIADTAVKVMQKIHQICSGTVIDENGYNIISYHKAKKIKECFRDNKKIVIFYKFKSELEILKKTFLNWTESPEDFQNAIHATFLGQFQSAREGIRLDAAEAIIFYNIDFSFLSYEQARNRVASFERTKNIALWWVFTIGGIEQKIYQAVKNKQDYTLSHYRKDEREIGT